MIVLHVRLDLGSRVAAIAAAVAADEFIVLLVEPLDVRLDCPLVLEELPADRAGEAERNFLDQKENLKSESSTYGSTESSLTFF